MIKYVICIKDDSEPWNIGKVLEVRPHPEFKDTYTVITGHVDHILKAHCREIPPQHYYLLQPRNEYPITAPPPLFPLDMYLPAKTLLQHLEIYWAGNQLDANGIWEKNLTQAQHKTLSNCYHNGLCISIQTNGNIRVSTHPFGL